MKTKKTTIIIAMCVSILSLTSCGTKNAIDAKYLSIYNDGNYLIFSKDGSFQNNWWTTSNNGTTKISDCYAYTIDKTGVITVVDTTEYEGQEQPDEIEIGRMYKDYICIKWSGTIPKDYTDTTLTSTLGEDLTLTFTLREDKTYELIVTSNSEITDEENGTYSINDNEVICTSNTGEITTFVNIEGDPYCVEYVKE